jgi:glutamine synthetase
MPCRYLKAEYIEDLFKKTGVLTPVELESRFEVYAEQYILSIEVEAKLVISMAKTMIYPAAVEYLSKLSSTMSEPVESWGDPGASSAQTVADLANAMMATVAKLSAACDKHDFADTEDHMKLLCLHRASADG